jgi:hypothetical protein
MAKDKYIRSMSMVGASQQAVEGTIADRFTTAEEVVPLSRPTKEAVDTATNRINPQLSCTITPEDKELLNEISLYACNREKKMLNTSIIVRALIRLGDKHRDELIF